jgi:hypothetical protein
MKPENHHEPSGAERVPPELIHALARLREADVVVAPATEVAILRAGKERMAAIRGNRAPRIATWLLWPLAAAACIALAWLALDPPRPAGNTTSPSVAREEDAASVILREFSALYPNQVKAIIQDGHGIELSLADEPYATPGKPLALTICEPRGCREIITFSGQKIEVAGHAVTVRTENGGRVILDGERFLWSSDLKENPAPGIHIESRRL